MDAADLHAEWACQFEKWIKSQEHRYRLSDSLSFISAVCFLALPLGAAISVAGAAFCFTLWFQGAGEMIPPASSLVLPTSLFLATAAFYSRRKLWEGKEREADVRLEWIADHPEPPVRRVEFVRPEDLADCPTCAASGWVFVAEYNDSCGVSDRKVACDDCHGTRRIPADVRRVFDEYRARAREVDEVRQDLYNRKRLWLKQHKPERIRQVADRHFTWALAFFLLSQGSWLVGLLHFLIFWTFWRSVAWGLATFLAMMVPASVFFSVGCLYEHLNNRSIGKLEAEWDRIHPPPEAPNWLSVKQTVFLARREVRCARLQAYYSSQFDE